MNIFVLDLDPAVAARMHCDKHIPKMCVEAAQMMASALRRHGATDEQMPLTKKGTPYKGGYHHHPCTVWAGDSRANFMWLAQHARELLYEYVERFCVLNNKTHACYDPIYAMSGMTDMIPEGKLTPFAQAMPDEYRDDDVVKAYRRYYHSKQFAKWEKGTPAPDWWRGYICSTPVPFMKSDGEVKA
jgi:hypothetical protein